MITSQRLNSFLKEQFPGLPYTYHCNDFYHMDDTATYHLDVCAEMLEEYPGFEEKMNNGHLEPKEMAPEALLAYLCKKGKLAKGSYMLSLTWG